MGSWPIRPITKEEAKEKKEALARLQEERKRRVAAPTAPAQVHQRVEEPTWDTVRRTKVDDDFVALTWMAHLVLLVGSTIQATGAFLYTFLKNAVVAAQYHWHYETCKKNGHDGTDMSCRLEQPRLIVRVSRYVPMW